VLQLLSDAYNKRVERWAAFREHICERAKLQFLFHLDKRGFSGRLSFDHDHLKLNIKVQTDGPKSSAKRKDAKGLSGGEKSFSTICLLLTMWEAVGCPIRCLDEFVRSLSFYCQCSWGADRSWADRMSSWTR
jgi:chromosome segregation ATPase